jgi:hypothetical protein
MTSEDSSDFSTADMCEHLCERIDEFEVECDQVGTIVKTVVFTDKNKEVIRDMFLEGLTNPLDDDDFDEIYSFFQVIEDELSSHFIQNVHAGKTAFDPIGSPVTPKTPERRDEVLRHGRSPPGGLIDDQVLRHGRSPPGGLIDDQVLRHGVPMYAALPKLPTMPPISEGSEVPFDISTI